jgi:hypothetical protein
MTTPSVNEFVDIINCHAEFLEEQTHYFEMMQALTAVALSGDFLSQPPLTLHYYLRSMSEILEKSAGQNEASLSLIRQCMNNKIV